MSNFLPLAFCAFASALVGLWATSLIRRIAPRIGLVDRPDARRKIHTREVPLGGGLGVFCGALAGLALGYFFVPGEWSAQLVARSTEFWGLLFAAVCVVAVGLVDDRFGLRGKHKLLGQTAAALCAVLAGLQAEEIVVLGWRIEFGVFAIPFSVFWLLGAMNALNLIDGADGLASSVGVVLCASIGGMALLLGHPAEAFVAVCLAGALVGFLRYNLPPASIYLGDAGSMLIGLVAGALAIFGSFKGAATVSLSAPLAIWAIPILDSTLAIVRRKFTGQSIYATDRGHLHHCLQGLGIRNWKLIVLTAALCTLTGFAAVISVALRNDAAAIIGASVVAVSLVVSRVFGHSEVRLLVAHTRLLAQKFDRLWMGKRSLSRTTRQTNLSLQGDREWGTVWEYLTEIAQQEQYSDVQLNLSAPWLHESYFARWSDDRRSGEKANAWRIDAPLTAQGRCIGRLTVAGFYDAQTGGAAFKFERFSELMESLESRLEMLAADPATEEPIVVPETTGAT